MQNFIISERPNELVRLSADEMNFEYVTLQEYNNEQRERCTSIIMTAFKNNQVTEGIVRSLLARMDEPYTWDESFDLHEQILSNLLHAMENHEYYDTIERIEKGEALYENETDPDKRRRYLERLNDLKVKLNALEMRRDAA